MASFWDAPGSGDPDLTGNFGGQQNPYGQYGGINAANMGQVGTGGNPAAPVLADPNAGQLMPPPTGGHYEGVDWNQHWVPDDPSQNPKSLLPGQGQGQQNINIDQIKALVGNDYSPQHLQQILPQLKALGVEVQNQARGDLRPRFLLPGGEQWDFGPGGWINSGHGVTPGFGDPSQAPSGAGGPSGGGNPGIFGTTDNRSAWLANTPGYQFQLDQGLQGIQRSAAARGTLLTGGTLKALQQYGEGLAGQDYWNSWDHYSDLGKTGLTATGTGTS